MDKGSYEFDPCSLDGPDKNDDNLTLDTWKPRQQQKTIIQSEWRKNQIGSNFNQQPGIDDLQKIAMYLKKKLPDAKVMETFGISCETLTAIKKNKYCPIEGIELDNLSKIYNEFKRLGTAIKKLQRASEYIAKTLFTDKNDLKKYKDYCKKAKIKNIVNDETQSEIESELQSSEDELID